MASGERRGAPVFFRRVSAKPLALGLALPYATLHDAMSLPSSIEPFTGTWTFNSLKSAARFSVPRSWVQHVQSDFHELLWREEIVLSDGKQFTVSLRAAFDGEDYAVTGSHYADPIAYERTEPRTILGTGKRNGSVTLRDTVSVSPGARASQLFFALFRRPRIRRGHPRLRQVLASSLNWRLRPVIAASARRPQKAAGESGRSNSEH
jgi:hypothetical protein